MADWDASDPFAEARKRSGVMDANFGGEQIPLILRHKDVRDAAANYQTFSSDTPFRVPIPSEERVRNVRQLPIEVDPPEHTDYKALVRPFFAAPKQPAMIATIEALVDDAVKQAIREKTVEIVHDFALPLQSRALTVLLGMPMQEAEQWISWGTNVFNDHDGHCEEKGSTLDRYLHAQFDRAEAAPGDDYFSALGA
ncbi:MAG: cytochrome P450, partial [Pseudomonadota bacterium]